MKFFAFIALVLGLVVGAGYASTAAQTPVAGGLTLSGGDLDTSVRLAPSDVDAFMRRINTPPRLDQRPERATGPTYTLSGQYWNTLLARPGRPETNDAALYYPEGGIVRAVQGGQDVWLALDLRQQGILARYIRLSQAGALSERPGVLQVLTAAAPEEDLTLEANGGALTANEVISLWGALASVGPPTFLEPLAPPKPEPGAYWLVFGLEEGRSLQLLYEPGNPGRLTDALGAERYTVSPEMATVLNAVKARSHNIDDRHSPGSYGWWVVMIGAGLLCLVVAVYLRSHPLKLPAAIEERIDRLSPPRT